MDRDYHGGSSERVFPGEDGERENRRRPYPGGSRALPKREVDGIEHHGYVVTLKDSYGFIECREFKDHIFFHFMEVKDQDGLLPLGNLTNDSKIAKIGNEVAFNLFFNEKRNKEEAANVRILEKGTLSKEHSTKKDVLGRVETAARTKRQTKLSNDAGTTTGIIRALYMDGTEETVTYECDDVNDMRTILHVGDEVTCNIVQGPRGNRKRAINIKLRKANPERRYRGILRALSDLEGVIYVADLGKDVGFHLKDVKSDVKDLIVGQEVECNLGLDSVEQSATAITVIAMHMKKENQEGRYRGIVQKECWPSYLVDAYGLDAGSGLIRAFTGQDKGIEFPFTADDVAMAYATLHRGDEVDFKVIYDPISGKRKASMISLSRSVKEHRERGKILTLDLTGGTLMSQCGDVLVFHASEFFTRDGEDTLKVEDLVEYVPFRRNNIPVAAVRISHIMDALVDDVDIVTRGCRGLILQEISAANHVEPGKIQIKRDGETKVATFRFKDLLETSKIPRVGDKAEFDLVISKSNHEYSAVHVMRVDVSSLVDGEYEIIVPNEQGILQNLKEGFGFIRTPAREGNLFFHFSEYKGTELDLKIGMPLEYTLVMDKKLKKLCAIRVQRVAENGSSDDISKLTKNSGSSDIDSMRHRGIVVTEFINKHRSKLYNEEARPGEIEYRNHEGLHKLRFDSESIEKGWLGLHVGDEVEFSILPDTSVAAGIKSRPGYAHKIVLVNPSREQRYHGIVVSIRDGFGFVKSSPRDQEVFFHFSEFVENGITGILHFGDEVEYSQIVRGGKPYAIRLERLPSGTLGRTDTGWIVSVKDSVINIMTRSGLFFSYASTELDVKDNLSEGDTVDLFVQPAKDDSPPAIWKLRKNHSSAVSSFPPSKRTQVPDSISSFSTKDKSVVKSMTIASDISSSDTSPMERRPQRLLPAKFQSSDEFLPRYIISEASKSLILLRSPKGPDGTSGFRLARNI